MTPPVPKKRYYTNVCLSINALYKKDVGNL